MRPFKLASVAFAVCASMVLARESAAATQRPNIVFLFADDMGWADTHVYGHPYAKTPSIDSLAADGTRFLQCYATGVTCCPSRTGFMTSRFPAEYPVYPANGGFADRVTITELLHQQGYATGHFGKWHIGPTMTPGTYGIDVIGIEDGADKPRKRRPGETGPGVAPRGRDSHIYDQAIRFIEQHKAGPFYINVWDHVPHHPINPSLELLDAFGPLTVDESKFGPAMQTKFANCRARGGDVSRHMRAYLADVKGMDDDMGRLLAKLDELGLRENTIVVFSSDQGPAPLDPDFKAKKNRTAQAAETDINDIRLNSMGDPGPFRGGKHQQYEGGVRIPFIVCWPGHAPAGRVDEQSVISGIDWLPTLCAITGTKIDLADFEGEDASRAWLGSTHVRTKPLLWKTSAPASNPAIRVGNWKLHGSNRPKGEVELYDLAADPGETNNLAAKEPKVVADLQARLAKWTATLPKEYEKGEDKQD